LTNVLPFIPDVPPEIIEAAETGSLVVFVGAGVSCLAGAPNWDGFAAKALELAVNKGGMNHAQKEQLDHLSPKIKLFIAKNAYKFTSMDYVEILKSKSAEHLNTGTKIYKDIHNISKVIVTTNYDEWLDKPDLESASSEVESHATSGAQLPSSKRVIYKRDEINVDKLTDNSVIHLHGSVKDPEEMVLTTKNYIKHYEHSFDGKGKERNSILVFLEKLFNPLGFNSPQLAAKIGV